MDLLITLDRERMHTYSPELRIEHAGAFLRESRPREIALSLLRARRFSRNLVSTIQLDTVCEVKVPCQRAANGLVRMPQALKSPCLSQFLSCLNFLFPVLWGSRNWPPSIKVKKLKIFWDKMGSKGCKYSSLNAPGTETPLSHPILKLDEFSLLHISPLG